MITQFKIGDLVKLKTPSPTMTVTDVRDDNSAVYVKWYNGTKGEFQNEIFPPEALIKAEE